VKTIFAEQNVAADLTFNFTSAIRYNKSLLVDGTIVDETFYECPDEGWACKGTNDDASVYVTCGCPYSAWVACAMDKTATVNQQVNFIACWDDTGMHSQKQNDTTLEGFAHDCSIQSSLDWSAVKECHDTPKTRADLLWDAANRFMDKWPEFAVMGGHFHVPHVLIGADLSTAEDMENINIDASDIPYFNKKICSLGVDMTVCPALDNVDTTTTLLPPLTTTTLVAIVA